MVPFVFVSVLSASPSPSSSPPPFFFLSRHSIFSSFLFFSVSLPTHCILRANLWDNIAEATLELVYETSGTALLFCSAGRGH